MALERVAHPVAPGSRPIQLHPVLAGLGPPVVHERRGLPVCFAGRKAALSGSPVENGIDILGDSCSTFFFGRTDRFFFYLCICLCIWCVTLRFIAFHKRFALFRMLLLAFPKRLNTPCTVDFAVGLSLFPSPEPAIDNHAALVHGGDNGVHIFRLAAEECGQPISVIAMNAATVFGLGRPVHKRPDDSSHNAGDNTDATSYPEPFWICGGTMP